jgi:hypothetical protein
MWVDWPIIKDDIKLNEDGSDDVMQADSSRAAG